MVQVYCDFVTSGGPYTLASFFNLNTASIVNYFDFKQKPNYDFKRTQDISVAASYYSGNGLDVNNMAIPAPNFPYSPGRSILMKAKRNFGSGTGMIFSTSNLDDDGFTICNDFIGTRTHTTTFSLRGTALSNILPSANVVKTFGFMFQSEGAYFNNGVSFFPVSRNDCSGSNYDTVNTGSFALGSRWSTSGDQWWSGGNFWIEKFVIFNAQIPDATLASYIYLLDQM